MSATTMRRLGAAALLLTSAMFLSRIIGYLREAFVAARFGANGSTDAFYAAFTIPDWLNYLVAGGTLSVTLLPIYARYLAARDEHQANRVFSAVATLLLALLAALVVAAEAWARPLCAWFFHRLDASALESCIRYTRILLPAQLFFVAGGLASATLLARGRFVAIAIAPLIYNGGIIAGGVLLGARLGAEGLAWGALAGALAGPLLIPAIGAWQAGARLHFAFSWRHPAVSEWVRLSLPLMVGVSLITADDWLIRYFAGGDPGAITRLSYAKRLVTVPIAIAGQAVGQASMPFFARLFAEGKRDELADTVHRTIRGVAVVSLLVAAWMIAVAHPLVDLLFRRGEFRTADVAPTALYLAVFTAAVPLWSVQGLASRAFYAARNTLTPMVAGTVVTAASVPIYAILYNAGGPAGLALASGLGILTHTVVLLVLLPRVLPEARLATTRTLGLVSSGFLVSCLAGIAAYLARTVGLASFYVSGYVSGQSSSSHQASLLACAVSSVAFLAVVLPLARFLGVPAITATLRRLGSRFGIASRR
ncbi:MAG: lipid II flippase MurJ [Pseudomonadota bacterium]